MKHHESRSSNGYCIKCNVKVDIRKKFCATCIKIRNKELVNHEKQSKYYKKWYKENGRSRSKNYIEIARKWRMKNREKVAAMLLIKKAIKEGKIKKPTKCSRCGSLENVHSHHEDYNMPFDVIFLCSSCHKRVHSKNKNYWDKGYAIDKE